MARRKDKRRVSKEQLALVCRKDFNAAGVSEQECLAGFLYAVRNQGEWFPTVKGFAEFGALMKGC